MSISPKDSDEQEVFEIQDYTTASDWERFTASVEEILRDWQLTSTDQRYLLPDIDIRSGKIEWKEKSTTIKFSDYCFTITYHFMTYDNLEEQPNTDATKDEKEGEDGKLPQFLHDIMSFRNDFPGKAHCLVRWYGLREFVTLVPVDVSQPIYSPSRAKIVLSSLSLAANNTGCHVPLFLQVSDLSDKVYMGVGFGSDLRTDFEMAYVKNPPPQCTHLSGLLDVLKNKIGSSLASSPVMVSIRFTYILNDWPHTLWSQQPPDLDAALSDVGFSELGKFPFGAMSDPVSELQVSTTWPCVGEYSLMDSEVQSDLNPSSAPIWSARLGTTFAPPCLLSEYLSEFLQVSENEESIVQILGHDFDPAIDDGSNIINALDRLTGSSIPSFSSVMSRARSKPANGDRGPVPEETLSLLLYFLFPDTQSVQEESAPYFPSKFSHIPVWDPPVEGLSEEHPLEAVLRKMKSCDVDSFVWRLSVLLCHVNHSLGGLSSVAHLYYEVLMELRFCWDNAILIPGLKEGPPDMATCLINQKLQMLNCCILHKIAREEHANKVSSDETLEDEEEFYECDESIDQDMETSKDYSSWDKPEGRLKRFGKARLLKRNDYLYIPLTQEAAPVTEDMLEEQTVELLGLGCDSYGSCQRAKLMSSSLLSDMESFKAANPGAVLEDFVRWYSPRDWIEEEDSSVDGQKKSVKGHLSKRMLIPGNLWREVWENAKPVPARRQKRLFDDTREAEKVLYWLNTLNPGKLCRELLPVVMHAALCRVTEEPVLYTLSAIRDENLPNPLHENSLSAQFELLAKRVSRLSWQPPNIGQYKSVYFQIDIVERCVAKAQSLRLKLLGHTDVSSGSLISVKSGSVPGNQTSSDNATDEKTLGDSSSVNNTSSSSLENLVAKLLYLSEVTLEGGAKGLQARVIKKLFSDARNSLYTEEPPPEKREKHEPLKLDETRESARDAELGKPAGREYLLRTHAAFPADHSREFPQRLYAVILKKSFRMAGAITQDTLFC